MDGISKSFIAAGGNRHSSAADVEKISGLVAFGTDKNIALWTPVYDKEQSGIGSLLTGHNDIINVVKFFVPNPECDVYLLSGSADGEIRIWRQDSTCSVSSDSPFVLIQVLKEHRNSLNTIAVLPKSNIFISGAASSELKVWKCTVDAAKLEANLTQSIALNPKFFPLTLAATRLPGTGSPVIAVGGSKSLIQVFVSSDVETKFSLAATLTGHGGWMRALDFCEEDPNPNEDTGDLLLASASQDKFVRLWRFHKGADLPPANKAASDPLLGAVGASLSNKAHRFTADHTEYSVTFEALLVGHEDWICNARWDDQKPSLRLLTSSADNSLAIWEPDPASGVWVCTVRLGEINAQKGATTATGSAGGFWISLWHDQGNAVLGLGRTGSWRSWHHDATEDAWTQSPAVSGHTRQVTGIAWAKDGSYLLSTCSDQTTRMYAATKANENGSWHEFARPQIHGYDISCIDTISNTQFITGAEEKLLRVFNEPQAVADLLYDSCGISSGAKDFPEAANIPVLGLSNKAIEAEEPAEPPTNGDLDPSQTQELILPRQQMQIHGIPLEDHLSRHLLWPETEKLYGHGYEISAVAASHNGTLVASACRASSLDHAVIRLYETSTWHAVTPPLAAHSLTVTRLQFSPDDEYLLSVGRDRQCAVFQRGGDGNAATYTLLVANPKAHSRMLLDAAWAPLDAGRVFATAGRDKAVHIWRLEGVELVRLVAIPAAVPVTAVAVLPWCVDGLVVLAYGLEDGKLVLAALTQECSAVRAAVEVVEGLCPSRAVTQLAWRPLEASPGEGQLAVASEDCSVRILTIGLQGLFQI